MKFWFFIGCFCFITVGSSQDKAAIRKAFSIYKEAILTNDGEKAYSIVNQNTKDFYTNALQAALHSDSVEIASFGFMKQLITLSVRHRIPNNTASKMTGKQLFIHTINKGWINKDEVAGIEIADIESEGKYAIIQMKQNNEELPYFFHFENEKGIWKFDLTAIMDTTDRSMEMIIKNSKTTTGQFVTKALEQVSGKKTDASIWHPKP